ncbi:MOT2 transcription factor [Handroanthus impetiginosus]|uniref:MOT2 transcription factor n=1 Tax=Handroanthus impetiginosus TaxID=429701 RepID=A0A2G9HWB5_9LAMI|nr:MOT2 transcription factor [Handroanthus impetiginosus]
MSNEEEKRCPLCAEEMDWTDQQFKPCKCGYQVCVWCWHHIMDMAEKDQTEGRCPACRTIYEKDKIVAMQANCDRMATKNSNRKTKPPKVKPKNDEVKKDLSNVRVIQRKMVYVIGLPLSLADEDVLQRKEYFGQYGKVTKVSLSRTAGGTIQQFINDTCSVYVTYSKEDEALRCIQSVHGFVLEGMLLRASFGTAKYCHAWLKNMPCNNPSCLYLHSIGADEDSFGKDEIAAAHTRSRVQQIVGATNNLVKRSGNVLPPPVECNNMSAFIDKSTVRSGSSDAANGSVNSTGDLTCTVPTQEKKGGTIVPQKMTTFVDIVGRLNCSFPGKDGNVPEDRRILNLSSELSSVTVSGDIHAGEPYSVNSLLKVSSPNCIGNGLFENTPDEPRREDTLLFDNQGVKHTGTPSQKACFHHPYNPAIISDDSGGPTLLHKNSHSVNDFSVDLNPINNCEDEASLPIRFVNSTFNDSCEEMKFQSSSNSDRMYKSTNSFSNEEIVEHLRRIDDNLTNGEGNFALDAVESSIISNIMSIDFDSCEDSLTLPIGLSKLLDESDSRRDSSWKSLNSDQSGYSFIKQDGFASQLAGSILPDYWANQERKPQYPVSRAQSLGPPGFLVPSRDPPPGFSTHERTGCLARPSSDSRLFNTSSIPSTLLQPSPPGYSSSSIDGVDYFYHAISNRVKYKPTNGLIIPGIEMRQASTPRQSAFEDNSRLWCMMKETSVLQDPKFSRMSLQQTPQIQQEPSYTTHKENGLSCPDDMYGLSSRLVDQLQNYDASIFTQKSHLKYANGNVSNTNGYWHSLEEVQHKGQVGMTEFQRNERLGANKYFSWVWGSNV